MGSSLWTCLILVSLASSSFAAIPRRPVDVAFGRNYVPTWAFDHIKYFNGGSEIQLHLDKYTGMQYDYAMHLYFLYRWKLCHCSLSLVCLVIKLFIFSLFVQILSRYWLPVQRVLLVWSLQHVHKDGSWWFSWHSHCFLCKKTVLIYLFGLHLFVFSLLSDLFDVVATMQLSSQTSEHDEIDFEFLGNRTGQPYILQTNVFTGGKGDREQRIYLWFDPTLAYHRYSILWNMYQIV